MVAHARRRRHTVDIWPGFVDALATLLMVIIFLLMIFVLAQFFLSRALSGRDSALRLLQNQVAELSNLLALEQEAKADLGEQLSRLTAQLQATLAERDQLGSTIAALKTETAAAEARLSEVQKALAEAIGQRTVDQDTIARQTGELSRLAESIAALQALKEELEKRVSALATAADEKDVALLVEREISESARAQLALLNQQMTALRQQIAQLNAALEASERKSAEQQVQIAALGQRLNLALAGKVQELARYRSEFFGRLREVLGDRAGIRIVGDRFVFQSEVLFATGSAVLEDEGREQILQVADTLKEIAGSIPPEIDWILQVEGHTDRVPIIRPPYPSNWELSTARATSVVRLLTEAGIPPARLSVAGFGEYHPIDPGTDAAAFQRNRRIELKLTQR
jgi:chemotaxis protein MotB